MTIGTLYDELVVELQSIYPLHEATNIMRLVFQDKLNTDRMGFVLQKERELEINTDKQLRGVAEKLLKGQPVQQIIGKVHFLDCPLRINHNVLIPRPETEELAQMIVKDFHDKEPFILDVGTGSGCLAISLARNIPDSTVTAIDISQPALELARINGIANNVHIDFQNLDIREEESWKRFGEYDVIVSNPPYIPESEKTELHDNVLRHEPHVALFVPDDDPILFYKKISDLALKKLVKGGHLYFETHVNYAKAVKKMLNAKPFDSVKLSKDMNGRQRFIRAIV
ncbi:MAG: peptide chain release factor N(5)-glutamine methyltransferase [Bacteroidota bacterium]|nr:peptide chain release factor N(5)-glutamine methyltransferase [Bacteroidota bacterium]